MASPKEERCASVDRSQGQVYAPSYHHESGSQLIPYANISSSNHAQIRYVCNVCYVYSVFTVLQCNVYSVFKVLQYNVYSVFKVLQCNHYNHPVDETIFRKYFSRLLFTSYN